MDYSYSLALSTLEAWNQPKQAQLLTKQVNRRETKLTLFFALAENDELVVTGIKWHNNTSLHPSMMRVGLLESTTDIPENAEAPQFQIPSFPTRFNDILAYERLRSWEWEQPTETKYHTHAPTQQLYNSILLSYWLTLVPMNILRAKYSLAKPAFPRIVTKKELIDTLGYSWTQGEDDLYACLKPNAQSPLCFYGQEDEDEQVEVIPLLNRLATLSAPFLIAPSHDPSDTSTYPPDFYTTSAFPITWKQSDYDEDYRDDLSEEQARGNLEKLLVKDTNNDLLFFVDTRYKTRMDAQRSIYSLQRL